MVQSQTLEEDKLPQLGKVAYSSEILKTNDWDQDN
jgi:hypothetical protein